MEKLIPIRKKYLLGVNKKRLFIGDFEIRNWNGYNEFTASFSVGEAFNIEDIDDEYIYNYMEDLWDSVDDETKLNWLDDGEITKQEYFEQSTQYAEYREIVDCSCTDYEITLKDGKTINFETTGCGQCDIREQEDFEEIKFTNKNGVMLLLELWDKYHLKKIEAEDEAEISEKINKMMELLGDFDRFHYENIEDFLVENVDMEE